MTLLIPVNTEYMHMFLNILKVLKLQDFYCFSAIITVYMCTNNVTIVTGIPCNSLTISVSFSLHTHNSEMI